MKILVISTYFGPENSIGVLRVNSYVKHWAENGHVVHVITMPFSEELPSYISDLKNVFVHQVPSLIAGRSKNGASQSYSHKAAGFKKIAWLLQNYLKRKIFCNYLDPRFLWLPPAILFGKDLSKKENFDFIFSTAPSYSAHSVAAFLKTGKHNLIWVADYRDLWSGNPIYRGCGVVRIIERAHERLVLSKSNIISSINEDMINHLRYLHGEKTYLNVPNGFSDHDQNIINTCEAVVFSEKVNISYFGSVIPGHHNVQPVLSAIKQLSDSKKIVPGEIKVRFFGNSEALDQSAIESDDNLSPFVEFCGFVPRNTVFSFMKGSNILLFLGIGARSKSDNLRRGVVSGKIFEMMISGVEIMAVGVDSDMIVADLILGSGTGDIYGDSVQKIKDRLIDALDGSISRVNPKWEYLNLFRRSVHAEQIIQCVNDVKVEK